MLINILVHYFSARTNRLLPDIVKSKLSGNPLLVRNLRSTRPWQHVLDPLHGYLLALEKSLNNEIAPAYNFGPESKSLTVQDVLKIANDAWRGSIQVENLHKPRNNKYEAGDLAIDSSLSSEDLNWSLRWSQVEAVRSTINWWVQVSEGNLTPDQACVLDIEFLFT